MAHRITIPQPDNNYIIGSSFNDLFKVIAEMESTEDDEIIWDFSNVRLLNPFFLLPLWLYKQSCGKLITYCNMSSSLNSYLGVIHFENGFDTEKCADLESSLNSKRFSIYCFSANPESTRICPNFLPAFATLSISTDLDNCSFVIIFPADKNSPVRVFPARKSARFNIEEFSGFSIKPESRQSKKYEETSSRVKYVSIEISQRLKPFFISSRIL